MKQAEFGVLRVVNAKLFFWCDTEEMFLPPCSGTWKSHSREEAYKLARLQSGLCVELPEQLQQQKQKEPAAPHNNQKNPAADPGRGGTLVHAPRESLLDTPESRAKRQQLLKDLREQVNGVSQKLQNAAPLAESDKLKYGEC